MTPWTGFWVRNYFAQSWPWLGTIMFDPYVRGAVTGIGLITMAAGLRELIVLYFVRRAAAGPASSVGAPRP